MAKLKASAGKYFLIKKASTAMFTATVIASIIVSFSLVTIKLLWETRSFNNQVHQAQEEARDTLIANIENYKVLEEDFNNLEDAEDIISDQGKKSNSAVILDAMPSQYDFPAIVTAIQNLATTSGVRLSGLTGDDNVENAINTAAVPTPIEIPFTISVTGSYDNVQKFLDRTERTIRPYYVNSIQLAGSDRSLRVNIEMLTYYQPAIDVNQVETEAISQ